MKRMGIPMLHVLLICSLQLTTPNLRVHPRPRQSDESNTGTLRFGGSRQGAIRCWGAEQWPWPRPVDHMGLCTVILIRGPMVVEDSDYTIRSCFPIYTPLIVNVSATQLKCKLVRNPPSHLEFHIICLFVTKCDI
jgi:hypothetical protein